MDTYCDDEEVASDVTVAAKKSGIVINLKFSNILSLNAKFVKTGPIKSKMKEFKIVNYRTI